MQKHLVFTHPGLEQEFQARAAGWSHTGELWLAGALVRGVVSFLSLFGLSCQGLRALLVMLGMLWVPILPPLPLYYMWPCACH